MKFLFKKIIANILKAESKLVLRKYKPKIIAITGSIGKTSTKDAVYAVLSKVAYVRKSEKSYNSEVGLPLTILGVPNGWNNPLVWLKNICKGFWLYLNPFCSRYPKWLILEVGVGKPGDMRRTALWLKTDVVIITAIGETPAHIEFFNSRKQLIDEKAELIRTLKQDGLLILNSDDEDVLLMKTKTKNITLTYGFKEGADVLASQNDILYDESGIPKGVVFRIDEGGTSLPIVIEGVAGKNHLYASLASIALALGLKFNIINAIDALKNYDVPPGRMKLLKGVNGSVIIDDTYNSSPAACKSALETLGEIKSRMRKIAILGDMLELGRHTEEAHKNIGRAAAESADILAVVGPRAQSIKEGAEESGMKSKSLPDGKAGIFEFLNSKEAGRFMETFVEKGDLVLVKGSQGMRMERVVEAILDKENLPAGRQVKDLLVRQDREWLNKA